MEARRYRRLIRSNVTRGLIISAASAVYGALGVLGYLGKRWSAEDQAMVALLGILMGLGIASHYLTDRAERIGDVSTRRRFAAASVFAGIVGFVLIATGAWRDRGLATLAGIYLGIAGLHYLGNRAEKTGDGSARQFTATSVLAGIVHFALIVAGALPAALMVTANLAAVVVPWLPWPGLFGKVRCIHASNT